MRAAILTVSTSVAAGASEDVSGAALAARAREAGAQVIDQRVVSDDRAAIAAALRDFIAAGAELVFTTGGTGLTPDDVTPEATREVIDREVPGIAEAMRAQSLRHTPMGMISREVSGAAGRTLIVNFPGSPRAIEQLFPVIAPVLEHAVATLRRERGARGLHGQHGGHAGH
jgi:molybdenum cofactor synthesis domain-containing protein